MAVVVVLPEPCRPTIRMPTGGAACRSIGCGVGAEHRDELVVDDLDDHLAGRHRAQHFGADGLGFDLLGEVLDDIERDVGFEQRAANFAHRLDDVAFGQRAAPRQLVEDA